MTWLAAVMPLRPQHAVADRADLLLLKQDELRAKEAAALKKLEDFVAVQGEGTDVAWPDIAYLASGTCGPFPPFSSVALAGAVLPDGWSVKIRVRLTQRRRGSFGRTSDNFYHTPCGSQVFRNYRQVRGADGSMVGAQPCCQQRYNTTRPCCAHTGRPVPWTARP